MGTLTAKQVIAYSKADPKKHSDGEGLYFCVRKQGSPYWMIRYTTAKGRREATLGQFPLISLADARIAAAYFRKEVLDCYIFNNLNEVKQITEDWIELYNNERPHDSLNDMTPFEYRNAA